MSETELRAQLLLAQGDVTRLSAALQEIADYGFAGAPDVAMRQIARTALAGRLSRLGATDER